MAVEKRILVYADPHWSQYSSIVRSRGEKYSTRLHNLIDSLNWVENLAGECGCNEIVCAGDFFDRETLNCEEITALQDLAINPTIWHTFIVGNHESNVSSLEFSSTKYFESIDADVISSIKMVSINDFVDLYYVPYATDNMVVQPSEFIQNKNKKNIVIAHTDIAGLRYGKYLSSSGMDIDDIKNNCTLFLDGHLHNNASIAKNAILIGNLTGQNFNEDAFQYDHLVYILSINDSGQIVLMPYENPYAMNFMKLHIETEDDFAKLDTLKNNSVLSVTCVSDLLEQASIKLHSNPRILDYRLTLAYTSATNQDIPVNLVTKTVDQMEQFIVCAHNKFGVSALLDDELSRLKG